LCFFVVNGLIKGEIEKPSGHYLGLICDESLTCHGLNSNPGYFSSFTFIFVLWCAGDRCDMAVSYEDHGRSRRPGAEDRGWSGIGWVLGSWTIEMSGDTLCGLHHARGDEERGFLS
jgi:hypothetical protein